MLSHDRLREVLHYDPDTGVWTWRIDAGRWGEIKAGTVAGSSDHRSGYRLLCVDSKLYRAARLAIFYMTGEMPLLVDHANRITSDDRYANLRPCNRSQNAGRWRVTICGRHVGVFRDKDEAIAAYHHEANRIFGEFAPD